MENSDGFYPQIHKRMAPYVDEAVATYGGGERVGDEEVAKMARHIVQKSGLLSDTPPYHNERTLDDMARVLVADALCPYGDCYDDYYYPWFYPYFTPYPYYGGYFPRGGYGGFYRGGGGGFRGGNFRGGGGGGFHGGGGGFHGGGGGGRR